MIIISGWIQVPDEARDELVTAMVPLQVATRHDETGCTAYSVSADPTVPGRVLIFEAWETAAALEAHFVHPNFAAARTVLRGYPRIAGEMAKHRVDASGPIVGSDGQPTATF